MKNNIRQKIKTVHWAWAFYDFANSSYALLISGVAFQIYFKQKIFQSHLLQADFYWALTISLSILLSAFFSPFLGAYIDQFRKRKKVFNIINILTIGFTCSLALIGPGQIILGVVLFFMANFLYNLVLFIYDSYLGIIANKNNLSEISGLGWGLGYLGGLLCLALTFPLFSKDPTINNPIYFQIGFLFVGLFFLVFSLPSLIFLPRENQNNSAVLSYKLKIKESTMTVMQTIRQWRKHKDIYKFILAYYFISEAIMTTIYFTANYLSSTFKLTSKTILFFTVIVQIIGFPATWLAGFFSDKWNMKKAFLFSAFIWIIIITLMAVSKHKISLYFIAILMGFVIGSTQAVGRAFFTSLTPHEKLSEFFGYNSLSSKIAATSGPLIFGIISSLTKNQRYAWLSLLPFLVVGIIIISTIKNTNKINY